MNKDPRCWNCDARLDLEHRQPDGTVICTVCGSRGKIVSGRSQPVRDESRPVQQTAEHGGVEEPPSLTGGEYYSLNPTSQLQILFSFQGRISRSTFWLRGWLPLVGLVLLGLLLDLATAGEPGVFYLLFRLAVMFPYAALLAKRCHDRDKSGWFSLIILIPFVGAIWLFIDPLLLRGTVGDNRFGPDPLGAAGDLVAQVGTDRETTETEA